MLGGGMSSRLFQTIREDQGLAYSIFSEMSPFRDTGSLCVYAGTSVDKTKKVLQLTLQELRRLKEEMVSDVELKRAKDQLKSNMVIGLESSGSRMSNLARQQMYFNYFFGQQEILDKVEGVSAEQVMEMSTQLFEPELVAVTLLGRLDGLKLARNRLVC
jgi:predicted Zn-dependent peptidase